MQKYIQFKLAKPSCRTSSERGSSGALYLAHVSAVLNLDRAYQVQVL